MSCSSSARGSGIEDGQVPAQAVTVRQGKILVIRDYFSRAEALEAAGRRNRASPEED